MNRVMTGAASAGTATGNEATAQFCGHCGEPSDGGAGPSSDVHHRCSERLAMEPPRHCAAINGATPQATHGAWPAVSMITAPNTERSVFLVKRLLVPLRQQQRGNHRDQDQAETDRGQGRSSVIGVLEDPCCDERDGSTE
jgi:hypothetical protein